MEVWFWLFIGLLGIYGDAKLEVVLVGYGFGLGKKVYCQSMPKEHAHSIFCPKTTSV